MLMVHHMLIGIVLGQDKYVSSSGEMGAGYGIEYLHEDTVHPNGDRKASYGGYHVSEATTGHFASLENMHSS